MVAARRTRARTRSAAPAESKIHTRVQLEYRDINEIHNYDLGYLVGDIFSKKSDVRKFVVEPSGCFIWLGWKDKDGYGCTSYKYKTTRVPRLVFSICNRELLPGEIVRHTCDTPACINPEHLVAGTHKDNARDRVLRGRGVGHRKLTKRQVLCIRRELRNGYRNQSVLARRHNITPGAIWCIAHNITWR